MGLKFLNHYLVYTDLDGSLLDHVSYSFAAAKPALVQLQARGITVIPCTSKTFAEIVELQKLLSIKGPFIAENGAAVYLPITHFSHQPRDTQAQSGYWVKAFSRPKQHWVDIITAMKARFPGLFRLASEMTVDEFAKLTGLSITQSNHALQRNYGEPIDWLGSEKQKRMFVEALREQGATVLEGGRFLHLADQCDKGIAMAWLKDVYQSTSSELLKTVALGDSGNDIAMLERADYAVIIRSLNHEPPCVNKQDNVIVTRAIGPAGWREGVEHFIFDNK